MFEKERMFLHFQRFQNFRSAVFSFFATNFHLFFPTMPFETPIFLAYELSGKESRHYILLRVIMRSTGCAVQYWGITLNYFVFVWYCSECHQTEKHWCKIPRGSSWHYAVHCLCCCWDCFSSHPHYNDSLCSDKVGKVPRPWSPPKLPCPQLFLLSQSLI